MKKLLVLFLVALAACGDGRLSPQGGTITGVGAGSGLTGGGSSGFVNLNIVATPGGGITVGADNIGLTPCDPGQLLKWSGSAWDCAVDANGISNTAPANVLMKSNGTDAVASSWTDNGTTSTTSGNVVVGGDITQSKTAQTSWTLTTRGSPSSYPAVVIQPTTPDTVLAFDLMPKGVPAIGSGGYTWFDVCDADLVANPSAPVRCARVGTGGTSTFGSVAFNGATANDVRLSIDGTDKLLVKPNASTFFTTLDVQPTTGNAVITATRSQNTGSWISLANTNTGTGAYSKFELTNDGSTGVVDLFSFGTGYTTNGGLMQDSGVLYTGAGMSNGLNLIAAGGDVRVYSGGSAAGNKRCTFSSAGLDCTAITVNGTSVATTSSVSIANNVIPKGTGTGITASGLTDNGLRLTSTAPETFIGNNGGNPTTAAALYLGPWTGSTSATAFGFSVETGTDGNVYQHYKLGASGEIHYRVGQGTEPGWQRTWLSVRGADAMSTFRGSGGTPGIAPVAGTVLAVENAAADAYISILDNTNNMGLLFGNSTAAFDGGMIYSTGRSLALWAAGGQRLTIGASGATFSNDLTASVGTTTLSGGLVRSGNTLNDTDSVLFLQYGQANGVQIGDGSTPTSLTVAGDVSIPGPNRSLWVDSNVRIQEASSDTMMIFAASAGINYIESGAASFASGSARELRFTSMLGADTWAKFDTNGNFTAYKDVQVDGTLDVNGTLSKFGGGADGETYIKDGSLNFQYANNAFAYGYLNWTGYAGGVTQFRDLIVGDGKQNIVCTFVGSTKKLNCIGGLQVNGVDVATATAVSGAIAGTANTLAMFTGPNAVGNSPITYDGSASLGTSANLLLNSRLAVGSNVLPFTINSANLLFPDATPLAEFHTGQSTSGYSEAVVIRHANTDAKPETRRLGLLFALSGESSSTETSKQGGLVYESTSAFANSPSLYLVTNGQKRVEIAHPGQITLNGATTINSLLAVLPTNGGITINPSTAAPSTAQLIIKANGAGVNTLLSHGADNNQLTFDAEWNGTNWIARSTSAASIAKYNGFLRIYGKGSLTSGGTASFAEYMTVNLSTGATTLSTGTSTAQAAPAGSVLTVTQADGTANYVTLRGTSTLGYNFANTSSGVDGGIYYGQTTARSLSLIAGASTRQRILQNGQILIGDSATTFISNDIDVLVIGNTGTAQTASNTLVNGSYTGTFNTTSGNLIAGGISMSVTATRSSGANSLINRAAYFSASGADSNTALETGSGDVRLNTIGGTTTVGGVLTMNNGFHALSDSDFTYMEGGSLSVSGSTFTSSLTVGSRAEFHGQIFGGDTTYTDIPNGLDVLTIGNTGTSQTGITYLAKLSHSGTFDSTASVTGAYGIYVDMSSTRAAGANRHLNVAAQFNATVATDSVALVTNGNVQFNSHVYFSGSTPAISCGAGGAMVVGNDRRGIITGGDAASAGGCTITFVQSWGTNAPICTLTPVGTTAHTIAPRVRSASTTNIVVNMDAGKQVNYFCDGRS